MQVVRNVVFDPRMLPGGGATELAIAHAISKSVNDVEGKNLPGCLCICLIFFLPS
jgi:chaperonin GroEL (HSP60 family)